MTALDPSGPAARGLAPRERELASLLAGEHADPHHVLGAHPAGGESGAGVVVRAFHPEAVGAACLPQPGKDRALAGRRGGDAPAPAGGGEAPVEMTPLRGGLFEAALPDARLPLRYRLRFRFADGAQLEREDPYRFPPTVGELDLHLLAEGTHRRLWEALGARRRAMDEVEGVAFAVWAPNARRVSVVGDFCRWDERLLPMRRLGASGVWELFVPGVSSGALYKFEIKTREGALRLKTDPMAAVMEVPPGTSSRVASSSYVWGDAAWMSARPRRDPPREPMAAYEVHLGSWGRVPEEGNRPLTYREIAPRLVAQARRLGFTHVELLPVAEHPFTGSWGYQVTGYYAPSARWGTPDDFRFLVDHLHQAGIGVIVDWVPAHFPKDDFALRRFDGTALYEHEDPRRGEHPDWGTLIFNYGRDEVRSFLIANAVYWLEELHVDGLRVDAVASMLYLDYSRRPGEWVPNPLGGRENLDAVRFLRETNAVVAEEQPGCFMVAEESTAWPGVTRATSEGGLGFTFKWNMGWMHDTLAFFAKDPIYRPYHLDQLTFAMIYEYSERFVMPLSHDEVVHGKGSLLRKMPGDPWQRFANLRLLLAYQWTRPGKKLLFMGSELAPDREWNHDTSLDWHLAEDPLREGLARFLEDLGGLYAGRPCLWRADHEPAGFDWIDCTDRAATIVSFVRRDGEGDALLVVLNFSPVPRADYRIGAPAPGTWRALLCSDDPRYGGSGFPSAGDLEAEPVPFHGQPQSLRLSIPPLAALVLGPRA